MRDEDPCCRGRSYQFCYYLNLFTFSVSEEIDSEIEIHTYWR